MVSSEMTEDTLVAHSDNEARICTIMATRTGTNARDWHPIYKARFGLLLAFEAVKAVQGQGSVATQLLTCCTAVDPIMVAGLTPAYIDISQATASIDASKLCGEDLRAVVLQHTYGVIDHAKDAELISKAHALGVPVIEDCAHCVTRMAKDGKGAPLADVSVHSFGIEKMLNCHFGGAVWINPSSEFSALTHELHSLFEQLPSASKNSNKLVGSYLSTMRVINHLPTVLARPLRDFMIARNLFEPAVSQEERLGALNGPAQKMPVAALERALAAFEQLDATEAQHSQATHMYVEQLSKVPGVYIPEAILRDPEQPLLRFPILVHDTALADTIAAQVCAAGYYTTNWYRPELTPGILDEAAYYLPQDRACVTQTDDFVARVATLPCNIAPEAISQVISIVKTCVA